jgi:Uma2 family endonuclease
MSQVPAETVLSLPFRLNVQATQLSEEQFVYLCQENRDLRFELTADKELVITPPTGSETGWPQNETARDGRATQYSVLSCESWRSGLGSRID